MPTKYQTPYQKILHRLKETVPEDVLQKIPDRWEKVGDIVIVKLENSLKKYEHSIGEVFANILKARTVLQDCGGIHGQYREPRVKIIYGSLATETIHREHGVRFKFDPQKIMFSSGNMNERIRMSTIATKNEIIVDMFAGIGYFSIPIAVYSRPEKIVACEVNPVAYQYLCDNIVLNNVTAFVQPILGDNQKVAPAATADRVIMGYLHGTESYLPVAFTCLKSGGGILHFHEVYADELIPQKPLSILQNHAALVGRTVQLIRSHVVKTYAPGLSHVVLDVEVR